MLTDVIKRLRRAADALENLLAIYPEDAPGIAKIIGRREPARSCRQTRTEEGQELQRHALEADRES